MSDIKTAWIASKSRGDWIAIGDTLESGDDLQTAMLISLFSDRQAEASDAITDGTNDHRGWWGDQGQKYKVGSRLWILQRAKQTNETLAKALNFIEEALQWLIDDGVVKKFDITVEWTKPSMLGALIVTHKNDGSTVPMKFSWVWTGIN